MEQKLEEPTKTYSLGPQGGGEYLTPYKVTIFYHQNSIFESVVVALSDYVQAIPIIDGFDFAAAGSFCDHPSPEVIIFGSEFTRDDLTALLGCGFQLIHVFIYDESTRAKYEPADDRIALFDLTDFYDHMVLMDRAAAIYVLEHVICAEFPKYESNVGATCIRGRLLLSGLQYMRESPGVFLRKCCSTMHGLDQIDKMICRGQMIAETYERMASERLYTCTIKTIGGQVCACVYGGDLRDEMMQLAPIHPKLVSAGANYILMYWHGLDVENDSQYKWNLFMSPLNGKAVFASDVLLSIAPKTVSAPDNYMQVYAQCDQLLI